MTRIVTLGVAAGLLAALAACEERKDEGRTTADAAVNEQANAETQARAEAGAVPTTPGHAEAEMRIAQSENTKPQSK